MEEDYLERKDGIWDSFSEALGVGMVRRSDTADFFANELKSHPKENVRFGLLFAISRKRLHRR